MYLCRSSTGKETASWCWGNSCSAFLFCANTMIWFSLQIHMLPCFHSHLPFKTFSSLGLSASFVHLFVHLANEYTEWLKWPRTHICSNTAGNHLFMLWKQFNSLFLPTLSLAQSISKSAVGRSSDPPLEAWRTKSYLNHRWCGRYTRYQTERWKEKYIFTSSHHTAMNTIYHLSSHPCSNWFLF